MDLSNLEKQLDELEHRYQEWSSPIDQFTIEALGKVNVVNGYTASDMFEEMEKMRRRCPKVS